jgi:hypothetical protein
MQQHASDTAGDFSGLVLSDVLWARETMGVNFIKLITSDYKVPLR